MNTSGSSRPGLSATRFAVRAVSASAAIIFAASTQASVVYSWESGLEGWTADTAGGYSITTTSALGVTDGASALQMTAPASSMWWSAGFSRNLSDSELSQVFTGATQVGMDVTYNPGSDTWYLDGNITLIVQAEKVSWTELGGVTIPKGSSPANATWSISSTMASDLATSSWGQLVLKLTYGNGGSAPSVFYADSFTSDAISAIPEPSSYALALGFFAVAGVTLRRRRRA